MLHVWYCSSSRLQQRHPLQMRRQKNLLIAFKMQGQKWWMRKLDQWVFSLFLFRCTSMNVLLDWSTLVMKKSEWIENWTCGLEWNQRSDLFRFFRVSKKLFLLWAKKTFSYYNIFGGKWEILDFMRWWVWSISWTQNFLGENLEKNWKKVRDDVNETHLGSWVFKLTLCHLIRGQKHFFRSPCVVVLLGYLVR